MADALLDKSLDALIAERGSKRSTGVKVRTGAGGKALRGRGGTRKAGGGGEKAAGASSGSDAKQKQKATKRAPLSLQSKKIAKPSRAGPRSLPRGMPAMLPPPGMMMAPPPGWVLVPQAAAAAAMPFPYPGAMVPGRAASAAPRQEPFRRKDPEGPGKWTHDLCDMGASRAMAAARANRPAPQRPQRQMQEPVPNGTRLIVKNLADKVTEQDIEELFSTKGPLLDFHLYNDGSGEAYVVFQEKADAMQAIEEYNKLLLDGLKLDISLVPENNLMKLSSGLRVTTQDDTSARPSRPLVGASRLISDAFKPSAQPRAPLLVQQTRAQGPTIPRGMGDSGPSSYQGQGKGRGFGPGPNRLRSGVSRVVASDVMEMEQ